MARPGVIVEAEVELIEGDLSCLGNALVYLRLVRERVAAAAKVGGQRDILSPAIEDVARAATLVRRVQDRIATQVSPCPRAR